MKHLIIIGLIALALAACTTPHSEDVTVTYTTYGGFTLAEQALGVVTIDGRDVTIERGYMNGTVTSGLSYTASQESIDALKAAIRSTDYPNLPEVVEAPNPIPVADVGAANLTIERGTDRTHTVIELNWQDSMPDDVARIIDAIYAVLQEAPQPEYEAQRAFEPMQCEQTPWNVWYGEGNIQYLVAPTQEQLITDYYGQVHGIEIRSVEERTRDGAACEACGVCPQSSYYVAWIAGDDVEAIEDLGWGSVPSEPAAAEDLEGTWTLISGSDGFEAEATISFSNGRVSGQAPCNSYSGDVSLGLGTIEFETLAQTERACFDTSRMEDEATYFEMLRAIDTYDVQDGVLVLSGTGVELRYARGDQARETVYFIDTPCEQNPEWYPEFGSDDTSAAEAYLADLGIDADVTHTSRGAVCKACLDDCAASYLSANVDASQADELVSQGWLENHPFPDEPVTSE